LETAVELANIPDRIRGFGHVRERYLAAARKRQAELLDAFRRREAVPGNGPQNPRKTIAVLAG
jgi:indolepyruvate ferredoxin oxidoreductase